MANNEWKISDDKQRIRIDYDNENSQYKYIELTFKRIKSNVTNKFRLEIRFEAVGKNENIESNKIEGTIFCNILGLDEEIMNLREFGLFLNRKDVTEIKKLVETNFMWFEQGTHKDEEYKEILMLYIDLLDEEARISVEDFKKTFEKLGVKEKISIEAFRNWLFDGKYIKLMNADEKYKSQQYSNVDKKDNKSIRMYYFDIDKMEELRNEK